jgi:hypothetical protein
MATRATILMCHTTSKHILQLMCNLQFLDTVLDSCIMVTVQSVAVEGQDNFYLDCHLCRSSVASPFRCFGILSLAPFAYEKKFQCFLFELTNAWPMILILRSLESGLSIFKSGFTSEPEN